MRSYMYIFLIKIDALSQSLDKHFEQKDNFVWSLEVKLLITEFGIQKSVSFDLKRPNIYNLKKGVDKLALKLTQKFISRSPFRRL